MTNRFPSWCLVAALALGACSGDKAVQRTEPGNKGRVARTNTELGMGYLQQGERKLAIEKLQRAIEADSDYAPAQHGLAIAYQEFGQLELAEKHYRQALRLLPADGGLRNNFGAFLCGQKKYAEGDEQFRAALRDPTYSSPQTALENAGLCALDMPDYDKAEQYLRQALKIDMNLKGALLAMARLQFARQQHLGTRAYLQRYEALSQLPAQGLILAIQIERKLGDLEAVKRYTTQLNAQFPDSAEAQQLRDLEAGLRK